MNSLDVFPETKLDVSATISSIQCLHGTQKMQLIVS